jgi:hypothetical protein
LWPARSTAPIHGPSRERANVIPATSNPILTKYVYAHVEPGSTLYTDAHKGYSSLAGQYHHPIVDHSEEYVRGRVTTNGLENFWSLLKRGLHGTYAQASEQHLSRYIDERVFTFKEREQDDRGRFDLVLAQSVASPGKLVG